MAKYLVSVDSYRMACAIAKKIGSALGCNARVCNYDRCSADIEVGSLFEEIPDEMLRQLRREGLDIKRYEW